MSIRIGHDLLIGKSTLKTHTVIDVLSHYDDRLYYQTVDEEGKVLNVDLHENADIYAHIKNGIDRPETQDKEGKTTIEGDDSVVHTPAYDIGTKVKFSTTFKGAQLEVEGYVIRNFWRNWYLISEVGVSIPNRAWKVAHSETQKVS